MSNFASSFSIGVSALHSFERGIQIVGHNIANANTPGFVRQRADFQALSTQTPGMNPNGLGVGLKDVQRLNSQFTERALVQERRSRSGLEMRKEILTRLEGQFNDLDGSGLAQNLQDLFTSFHDLAADPASLPRRDDVLTHAESLAAGFRQQAGALRDLRSETDRQVGDLVPEINRLASQVAELNGQISSRKNSGQSTADLEDRRAELGAQLSERAGAETIELEDGQLRIQLGGGSALVDGSRAYEVRAVRDPADGNRNHLFLEGGEGDQTEIFRQGEMGQLLDLRDRAIPGFQRQLDDLAATLIEKLNTAHQAGFDLAGAAGGDFFSPFTPPAPGDNTGAAASLQLAAGLRDAPERLAASATGAPGDNGAARALGDLATQALASGGKTFLEAYTSLAAGIGADAAQTESDIQTSEAVFEQIAAQRQEVSGVNLDEEAANLITLQRGYEAAGRFLRTVDDMLKGLMQQLG